MISNGTELYIITNYDQQWNGNVHKYTCWSEIKRKGV